MGESLDEASGGLTVINNNVGRAAASFAWFMGMLDNVREPLEQMSEAAVAAFNDLQGITNTPNIDTSSLSSVTDALQRVRDETGRRNGTEQHFRCKHFRYAQPLGNTDKAQR